MKKSIFRFIGIVLPVVIPFLLYLTIDFLIEITGGNLGDYLQIHYGITRKVLFIVLAVLLLISLLYQIYKSWSEENAQSFSNNPQNIQLNVENLFVWIEKQYKDKYGKQVEVEFKFKNGEEIIPDENDEFKRNAESDGIRIYPSKKVYARLNVNEFLKKEFTVRYPILEGFQNESILFKINSILSYEKIFDVSLEESINGDTWLSELDYNIDYFKTPFLNITFHMDGVGAYPWHTSQSIVVNIETGEKLEIVDILEKKSLKRLASIIDKFVQIDLIKACLIDEYWHEIPLEESSEEFSPNSADINWSRERFRKKKITVKDLNEFSIDKNGITFICPFEFPYVIKAIEPEGHYYFEFSALKNFIKKGGLLEKFIEEI